MAGMRFSEPRILMPNVTPAHSGIRTPAVETDAARMHILEHSRARKFILEGDCG